MPTVRDATVADVEQMVSLIEARRTKLEEYEPVFWKRAKEAALRTSPWFEKLVEDEGVLCLIAEDAADMSGFLIATEAPVPPVYDPGGPTWMIDDFAVAHAMQWQTVGQNLIKVAKAQILERGGKQIVVVAPVKEDNQIELLKAEGLCAASIWLTQTL